ncbi:MAG: rRNA maturation RNAse YbeY, partial [Clostridia bacterium]|nr:rRNA maturation RNAse YbeY [Clostridia bacterium]
MILITEREECEEYGVDEALLQAAGKAVEERFSLQKDLFETEITFLSEEEIRELNAQTRGVDAVTDVLSYPYLECAGEGAPVYGQMDINPETEKVTLGSIAFCMARVKEQAAEYG